MARKQSKKVFISWSGDFSKDIASEFNKFLKKIFGNKTWLSFESISMGVDWARCIAEEIEKDSCGLILVTKENVSAPWLYFEAGALAKRKNAQVIPIYFGIERDNIFNTPLFLRQSVEIPDKDYIWGDAIKKDILRVLVSIKDSLHIKLHKKKLVELLDQHFSKFISKIDFLYDKHMFSQITDMHYETMGKLLRACDRNHEVVFFNIQTDVASWFNPYMQIHLAMHDSSSRRQQLDELRGSIDYFVYGQGRHNNLRKHFSSPASRIMFIPEKDENLIKGIKKNDNPYRKLIELALIHIFMATPLAIITLDDFVRIARQGNNKDFFNEEVEKILGIPKIIGDTSINVNKAYTSLKTNLDRMKIRSGTITPSIDFAVFRDENGNCKEIWGGSVDRFGEGVYFPINDDIHTKTNKKSNNFDPDNPGLTLSITSDGIKKGYKEKLISFSEIMIKAIFEDNPERSDKYHYICANSKVQGIFNKLNPILRAFNPPKNWHGNDFVRHIKQDFNSIDTIAKTDAIKRFENVAGGIK